MSMVSARAYVLFAAIVAALSSSGTAFGAPPAVRRAPPAPPGLAETLSGQAKADYEVGLALLRDGDFAGALVKFQASFEASKDPRLLFNLAVCEKSMRHYARAVVLLRQFVGDPSPLIPPAKRDEAAELAKTFEQFTVSLTVEVNETDAEVEIDDRAVGKTPLAEPILVDIGSRKVRVRKEGFRESVTTTLVGGNPTHLASVKLEREVHEGKLAVTAPSGALVEIDGKPAGPAPSGAAIELTLPAGGHTLRVTAPGMRTYEREVVVKDKETRSVDVQLERTLPPELPKLRVAVGCIDATPLSSDDGLMVFIDGTAAVPTREKRRWDSERNHTSTHELEFPVSAGSHTVAVRAPGCEAAEATVQVDPNTGGTLRGALRSDAALLLRGPAGLPDWGRVGAALWLPRSFGNGLRPDTIYDARRALGDLRYRPQGTGMMIHGGVVQRYWSATLEVGYAEGTADVAAEPANKDPRILAAAYDTRTRWLRTGARVGGRLPFHLAALSIGIGGGFDARALRGAPEGVGYEELDPFGSAWAIADGQVLCDWPVFAGFSTEVHVRKEVKDLTYALQLGAALQPNARCKTERSTAYGLTSSEKERP